MRSWRSATAWSGASTRWNTRSVPKRSTTSANGSRVYSASDGGATMVDLMSRYGFQVFATVIVLVAGMVASRWAGRLFNSWLERQAAEPPLRILLVRVLRAVVMLFAVVVALDQLGFQIAPLVAGIGVAGLGVGFALQGVLSNLMAGLTIIFTKPFRVGEYVSLLGVKGVVTS